MWLKNKFYSYYINRQTKNDLEIKALPCNYIGKMEDEKYVKGGIRDLDLNILIYTLMHNI